MTFISVNNLAAVLGTSASVVSSWAERGVYPSHINAKGKRGFYMEDLVAFPEIKSMIQSNWEEELKVSPKRKYNSIELFAGAGGLALGMEKAGFHHILLNEFDSAACNTLKVNRPDWTVIEGDVRHIDFSPLAGKIDFLSGGFPCQAFSFAGKQGGFNDIRGTLFFEMARAIKEIKPKVFMAENVKGLASHDNGKTFSVICNTIRELGYTLIEPRILKGIMYRVPQKRERIFLIAIRNDFVDKVKFDWPSPYHRIMLLEDALYKGDLFENDVPKSEGATYPKKKKEVLEMVPEGGDWRNLPGDIAKEYMGGSWNLGGGKTGMARRLSLDEPSLTLTCSPAQKQTERCHPLETRPLSVREYARIQTFPDDWVFLGTLTQKYKQIGNAVPVNLAWAVGRSIIRLMNQIEEICPGEEISCTEEVKEIIKKQSNLIVVKDNKNQVSEINGKVSTKQLNIFDLYEEFGESPISENLIASDFKEVYGSESSNNLLVGVVKKDFANIFDKREASFYYTGKRFPATVNLFGLKFFVPYISNKGIRDLYAIKKISIQPYTDSKKSDVTEYRMAFQLEFLEQLFPDYKKVDLKIWHSFLYTRLAELRSI